MKDPYEVLGVQKTASEAAIRAAYRKLAKRHHPDLNPGKPEAAERFKEINAANDILSDPDKRARYDRGEIDAAGNEVPPERPFYRDSATQPAARSTTRTSIPRTWRASSPTPSAAVRAARSAPAAAAASPPAGRTRTTR